MVVRPAEPRTATVDLLRPILESYLEEAQRLFDREGRPVGRSLIAPSPVTWDGDKDGMLWVRVVSLQPQPSDPNASPGSYDRCGPVAWQVNLALGVIRCISTLDSRGRPPRAKDVTEDGLYQIGDIQALADVIEGNIHTRAFQQWNPLPPQGGFAGGEWLFNVRMDNIRAPLTD